MDTLKIALRKNEVFMPKSKALSSVVWIISPGYCTKKTLLYEDKDYDEHTAHHFSIVVFIVY